jgi:hypothetical protein
MDEPKANDAALARDRAHAAGIFLAYLSWSAAV